MRQYWKNEYIFSVHQQKEKQTLLTFNILNWETMKQKQIMKEHGNKNKITSKL